SQISNWHKTFLLFIGPRLNRDLFETAETLPLIDRTGLAARPWPFAWLPPPRGSVGSPFRRLPGPHRDELPLVRRRPRRRPYVLQADRFPCGYPNSELSPRPNHLLPPPQLQGPV